jgi:integrase
VKHLVDAEKLVESHNADARPLGELFERKAELLCAIEQIRSLRVTLPEVVTFYVRHHVHKSNPTLSELVELFIAEKRRIGRSEHYARSIRYHLDGLMEHVGRNVHVADLTREQITRYVYVVCRDASSITKKNILTHLSVVLNYAVKEDMLGLNPVKKITRPTVPFRKPHVLTPLDFEKLLRRCLKNKWHDRLVIFVLVGFCGIRIEEASRLRWSNLQLDRGIVEVPAEVAKKAAFRNNVIPPNAMTWLRLVQDKRRTGPIIGSKWKTQLRTVVENTKIDYKQNCIRHSFCSYAIAAGWSLAEVIAYMGHGGGPAMVHSHYRNVVSPEDGKKWFSLMP